MIFAVFFLSGMAGLIYQVAWSRLLTLLIGVGIFAITAVVCTFMAGLALGAYLIGRWGDRWRDPFLAYGIIEGTIGVYAALTPWIFQAAQPIYIWGFNHFDRAGLNTFRVLLSAAILLVPTSLMGGTLPLLSRAVSRWNERTAIGAGLLYAVNTFGAVAGCLLAGFYLLAIVGVRESLFIAAAINLGIAALVIVSRRGVPTEPRATMRPKPQAEPSTGAVLLLAIFFFSGFAALGYEVLWTRALLVFLKASTYAFSLMLSVYLFGVAAGSLLVSWFADKIRRPLLGVAICEFGIAFTVVAGMILFPRVHVHATRLVGAVSVQSFGDAVAIMFTEAALILLLPTLFMGAMFPFGIAAYHRDVDGVARTVGLLYAVNTGGNILGSILIGFFAIELFGVRNSLVALVGLNLLLGAVALLWLVRRPALGLVWPVVAVGLIVLINHGISPGVFYNTITAFGNKIVYYREGASDTVAVVERPKEKDRTLIYSDGRGAAATSTAPWNFYFGHLPMLLHPNPKEVLHICYGSGNSVRALTRHNPDRIDVIELSPHVREASQYFWTNEGVISDPRVHLIIEDGRNYVLGTNRTYDVISLEPPNIYTAGVVNLYTQEFYELSRRLLKPRGIMVQWLPTSQLTEKDRGRLIRAFTEAFPYVTVWQQLQSSTILLVGTVEPLAVDVDAIDRRLKGEAMLKDMQVMKLQDAYGFLSLYSLSDKDTRELVASYSPVHDDLTMVDYSIPRFVGSGFGLDLYTYGIGDATNNPTKVVYQRLNEYRHWSSPASTIVPDESQAKLLDEALRLRISGRPVGEISRAVCARSLQDQAPVADNKAQ